MVGHVDGRVRAEGVGLEDPLDVVPPDLPVREGDRDRVPDADPAEGVELVEPRVLFSREGLADHGRPGVAGREVLALDHPARGQRDAGLVGRAHPDHRPCEGLGLEGDRGPRRDARGGGHDPRDPLDPRLEGGGVRDVELPLPRLHVQVAVVVVDRLAVERDHHALDDRGEEDQVHEDQRDDHHGQQERPLVSPAERPPGEKGRDAESSEHGSPTRSCAASTRCRRQRAAPRRPRRPR